MPQIFRGNLSNWAQIRQGAFDKLKSPIPLKGRLIEKHLTSKL
ncbi:hypothetical protein [Siminovitchia terrae]|nr:hypothetical protein [Siminovitchia terrae]